MRGKETQPKEVKTQKEKRGVIESIALFSRNVEIMVGAIAYFFGHLGFAAWMGIAAVLDHTGAKILEHRRTKEQKGIIFQSKPQTA